jgi:uncharacterized membrane protein YdfJ with MMPL/SSD domain
VKPRLDCPGSGVRLGRPPDGAPLTDRSPQSVAQHRDHGASDRDAVALGLGLAARVISAATLIMIAVFGSFVLIGDPTVKQFGAGLAVALALAADSVLLLTLAILVPLGRIAWWMPSPLERIVPRVDIDGEHLTPHLVDDHGGRPGRGRCPAGTA